ncbi:MAG: polyhydroxyalkanoic acid system family protein [Oligoflexia bacterium]|nr:polyhydroxyalkanoic acid system family protein [Oligoflexia bacterium]
MPKVNVKREIDGDKKKVFQAVKTYLTGRDTLKKLGANIDWDTKSCTGEIEGSNFSGNICVNEKSGKSLVEIEIDLPLLLSPFKGKVKEELEKHLERVSV